MEEKEPTKKERRLHIEIVKQMLTLATSGFGLVAALAWNNLIQQIMKDYIQVWIPNIGPVISLLIYAVIVTALAVFVTVQLSKLLSRLEEKS